MKILWSLMIVALLGIVGSVSWIFMKKVEADKFLQEVVDFQKQTATYDSDKEYYPGEVLTAKWTFNPIDWDEPFTMTAIFTFRNTDTDKLYLTGELRILPFFGELQYQVSEPLTHKKDSARVVTSTYKLPTQLESGTYVIEICQKFEYEGGSTTFTCYDGPTFDVRLTPRGS